MISEALAKCYCETVRQLLSDYKVKAVGCGDNRTDGIHFFDRVEFDVETRGMRVYNHGLKETFWCDFCYDFSIDYARVLDFLEVDLFKIAHKAEPIHFSGYEFASE